MGGRSIVTEPASHPSPPPAGPHPASFEAFLAWDHEGGLVEWVGGEVVFHDMPNHEHQNVVEFLLTLLRLFVNLSQAGKVRVAPYPMRMQPGGNAREPDLLFLSQEHLHRLKRDELDGPADLVVEVVSNESATRDRREKFLEYQEGGVREYWIIDPRPGREQAHFSVRDEHGTYQPVVPDADGRYHSVVVPGFWLKVAWLWEEPQPDPLMVLAAIAPRALRVALREVLDEADHPPPE